MFEGLKPGCILLYYSTIKYLVKSRTITDPVHSILPNGHDIEWQVIYIYGQWLAYDAYDLSGFVSQTAADDTEFGASQIGIRALGYHPRQLICMVC